MTTTTRTIIYQYDDLYRVTKATYCDGAYTKANPCTTPSHEYVYTYDLNGNRKTETITGAGLSSVNNVFNYNDANQLTTATINGTGYTYTYDNNGNLTNDGTTTYTYDAADRLITLANGTNTYTYTYNGLGDRLSQAVTGGSTTEYLLDLNANLTQVLSEYTQGATTPDVNYLHGHDIIGQQRGTTWHYFGYDGLGSNRFMTNSAGALTYSALYSPYGQVLSAVGPGNTNLGFTGEHTDPTGLQYLRARYYHPRTAAFLSRDPAIGVYPTLSGSWNGYSYAHGNPVMYTDPSGQCIFGIATGVCAAAALFVLGAGIEAGTQHVFDGGVHDWRMVGVSGVLNLAGYGFGKAAGTVGWSVGKRLTAELTFDFGTSFLADRHIRGESNTAALLGNVFGMGISQGMGHMASRAVNRATQGYLSRRMNRAISRGIADFEEHFDYDPGSVRIGMRSRDISLIAEVAGVPNKPVGAGPYFGSIWGRINKLPGGLRFIKAKDIATQTYNKWPRLVLSDLDIAWVTGSKQGVQMRILDDDLYDLYFPNKPSLGRFINQHYGRDIIQHGAHVNAMYHNAGVRAGTIQAPLFSGVDDISRALEDVSLYGGPFAGQTGDFMTTFVSLNPGLPLDVIRQLSEDPIYQSIFYP